MIRTRNTIIAISINKWARDTHPSVMEMRIPMANHTMPTMMFAK